MTKEIFARFEHYHPTISQVSILPSSLCADAGLRKNVEQYKVLYKTNLETICVFQKESVSVIQNSSIHCKARELLAELHNSNLVTILSYKEIADKNMELHRKAIAEIATCYQPDNAEIRARYQYHFGHLVRILFNEFFSSRSSVEKTIYLGPLRAGDFVCKIGLADTPGEVIYIHTKRVYYDENSIAIAIGEIDKSAFLDKQRLVICEGGLVSGLSIIGFLETLSSLNSLPKQVTICVVHASMYGIMNVLKLAPRLGIEINIFAAMTSFAIGKTLYAFYDFSPWKTGVLVTGDVGDYLEPFNEASGD